jgi:hypothetical protein
MRDILMQTGAGLVVAVAVMTAWAGDVLNCDPSGAPSAAQSAGDHVLAVFYVIPSDVVYEQDVHARIIEATNDIHAWYQCASGGLTWKLAFPEVARVYFAEQSREFYGTHGNWWGSLLGEMASKGLPI